MESNGDSVFDQCKAACPTVRLFKVPELRGKADLTIYRNASLEVFDILSSYDEKIVIERASIDEAFLDLTNLISNLPTDHKCLTEEISSVHVAGLTSSAADHFLASFKAGIEKTEDVCLVIAAKIMSQLKREIKGTTGFSCSCGISRNKIMSKLACGFKKPNGLSIFPKAGLEEIWKKTPIKKIRNLGGKLGAHLSSNFQIELMSELSSIPFEQLQAAVGGKSAEWISGILQGNDDEPVSSRLISKSVGCGKNFNGLTSLTETKHWILQLASELVERLAEDQRLNQRRARSMVFGIRFRKNFDNFTKTLPIRDYQVELIVEELMKTIGAKFSTSTNLDRLSEPIYSLYLTASKFVDEDVFLKSAVHQTARLDRYFTSVDKNDSRTFEKAFEETCTDVVPVCDESSEDEIEILELIEDGEDVEIVHDSEEDDFLNPEVEKSFFYRKTLQLLSNKEVDF